MPTPDGSEAAAGAGDDNPTTPNAPSTPTSGKRSYANPMLAGGGGGGGGGAGAETPPYSPMNDIIHQISLNLDRAHALLTPTRGPGATSRKLLLEGDGGGELSGGEAGAQSFGFELLEPSELRSGAGAAPRSDNELADENKKLAQAVQDLTSLVQEQRLECKRLSQELQKLKKEKSGDSADGSKRLRRRRSSVFERFKLNEGMQKMLRMEWYTMLLLGIFAFAILAIIVKLTVRIDETAIV